MQVLDQSKDQSELEHQYVSFLDEHSEKEWKVESEEEFTQGLHFQQELL